MKRAKAAIVGTGALGLGFLAERMSRDYDLCLADTGAKSGILSRIEKDQYFTVNVCGRDGIVHRKVTGSFETANIDTSEGSAALDRALGEADLVLTATGRKVLDKVVGRIAPAINARQRKVWLLFCENGLDIARTFAQRFEAQTVPVDTVMSRMCRFADPEEVGYQPMWSGGESLVVEDYDYLPLDADLCSSGPFSNVFSLVSPEEFRCWEDTKLYLHNGMHAFVAFHAYLEGARFFPETPDGIRRLARQVVLEEVVPAIARTHPTTRKDELEQYGLELLDRFFNPYFNDSIERGVRGIEEKLAPGERLVGGCEYIKRAGIDPVGYSSTIEIANNVLRELQNAK